MSNKKINFYYSIDTNGKTAYRCLFNGLNEIDEKDTLDLKHHKNFRMNDRYNAIDEDLYKFRDDLKVHNDEIKQHFFKNKDKTIFKVDIFNYNTINDAIYNNVIINSNQKVINAIPDIDFREFVMFQNCLSCGLMSVDKDILEKPLQTFGYDYSKFYYYMMKKIRIPTSKPVYYVLNELDFDNLDFGIYRVKMVCDNKLFWNSFNFNKKHHYTHNTLKTLYKYKDKYDIRFKLLEPDDCYNYNMVYYEKTVELQRLFKQWFDVIDNWLIKSYISLAWGVICKFNKIYVDTKDCEEYDWEHLNKITSKRYEYYNYELSNGVYTMIPSKNAFAHKGLARIKPFLTEYARNFVFDMINENNLEDSVVRIQTDGICFNKSIDFPSLGLKYYPIPEAKSTGLIMFHNINCYRHVCDKCNMEYKYCKSVVHKCL